MEYIKSIVRSSLGKFLYAFIALLIATILIIVLILFA